jgi:hypothetical protein
MAAAAFGITGSQWSSTWSPTKWCGIFSMYPFWLVMNLFPRSPLQTRKSPCLMLSPLGSLGSEESTDTLFGKSGPVWWGGKKGGEQGKQRCDAICFCTSHCFIWVLEGLGGNHYLICQGALLPCWVQTVEIRKEHVDNIFWNWFLSLPWCISDYLGGRVASG